MGMAAIAAGFASLRTAAELTRLTRDALKSGADPADLAGRIAEIYDYIIDSKQALLAAQEELTRTMAEIERLRSFRFHHSVSWRIISDGSEDGPFCPICVAQQTDMRLMIRNVVPADQSVWLFSCPASHVPEGKGREHVYCVPKTMVPENRYMVPK